MLNTVIFIFWSFNFCFYFLNRYHNCTNLSAVSVRISMGYVSKEMVAAYYDFGMIVVIVRTQKEQKMTFVVV